MSDDTPKASVAYREVALDVPGWEASATIYVGDRMPRADLVLVERVGSWPAPRYVGLDGESYATLDVTTDGTDTAIAAETAYPWEVARDSAARAHAERLGPSAVEAWEALVLACKQADLAARRITA